MAEVEKAETPGDSTHVPPADTGGGKEEWSVVWTGRTDTLLFVEVRNGLGGVWSGRLGKVE